MSGTLTCSVFLLQCFAIFGVMLLQCATFSKGNLEQNRTCTLTNYREYNYLREKSCSMECVNGEERIKCLHPECHTVLKTNIQNATVTVDCYPSEEFFAVEYIIECDFKVYYNNPKCRTDCYSGVQRTLCFSDRCSQSNSNNKNCTKHCDIAEQGKPCTQKTCHPHTYEAENGQNCTVTCDSGYKYITCSYLQCETKNFTFYDYRTELSYECSEYCENGEKYYICADHPRYQVPGYEPPNNIAAAISSLPDRQATIIYFEFSKFRQEMESRAREKFMNHGDEDEE